MRRKFRCVNFSLPHRRNARPGPTRRARESAQAGHRRLLGAGRAPQTCNIPSLEEWNAGRFQFELYNFVLAVVLDDLSTLPGDRPGKLKTGRCARPRVLIKELESPPGSRELTVRLAAQRQSRPSQTSRPGEGFRIRGSSCQFHFLAINGHALAGFARGDACLQRELELQLPGVIWIESALNAHGLSDHGAKINLSDLLDILAAFQGKIRLVELQESRKSARSRLEETGEVSERSIHPRIRIEGELGSEVTKSDAEFVDPFGAFPTAGRRRGRGGRFEKLLDLHVQFCFLV